MFKVNKSEKKNLDIRTYKVYNYYEKIFKIKELSYEKIDFTAFDAFYFMPAAFLL